MSIKGNSDEKYPRPVLERWKKKQPSGDFGDCKVLHLLYEFWLSGRLACVSACPSFFQTSGYKRKCKTSHRMNMPVPVFGNWPVVFLLFFFRRQTRLPQKLPAAAEASVFHLKT